MVYSLGCTPCKKGLDTSMYSGVLCKIFISGFFFFKSHEVFRYRFLINFHTQLLVRKFYYSRYAKRQYARNRVLHVCKETCIMQRLYFCNTRVYKSAVHV